MSKKLHSKNSILSAHVLNFIKSYVSETTTGEVKEGEKDLNHYRSPIQTDVELELASNTNQMQIDDTVRAASDDQFFDTNLDINEFTEPQLMFKAENEFQMPAKSKKENFLKGCKWFVIKITKNKSFKIYLLKK